MADIINLRAVRKQKARTEKTVQAQENRILFGRSKAEKLRDEAEKSMADKRIDGHKLES